MTTPAIALDLRNAATAIGGWADRIERNVHASALDMHTRRALVRKVQDCQQAARRFVTEAERLENDVA